MKSNQTHKIGHVSTLVLITLIILKVTETVNWSWWYILAPLWVPVLLLIILKQIGIIFFNDKW